jgi:hypothetical protein
VALDVEVEVLVLVFVAAARLDQVDMCDAILTGTIDLLMSVI